MVRAFLSMVVFLILGCASPPSDHASRAGQTLLGDPGCSAATCRCNAAIFKTGDCDLTLTTQQTLPVVWLPHATAVYGNSGPFTWPIPSGTIPRIYEQGESSTGGRTMRLYVWEIYALWRHVHGSPRTPPVADYRGTLFIRYPLKDSHLYVEVRVIGNVTENIEPPGITAFLVDPFAPSETPLDGHTVRYDAINGFIGMTAVSERADWLTNITLGSVGFDAYMPSEGGDTLIETYPDWVEATGP